MKTRKLLSIVALGGLTLVALGAVGSVVAGGGGSSAHSTAVAPDDGSFAGSDDVMTSIDQALGLPSTTSAVGGGTAAQAPLPAAAPPIAPAADAAKTAAAAPRSANGAASTALGPATLPMLGAAPSASTGASGSASSLDDRKIVQTASIRLQVKDVGGGFAQVGSIASAAGGFVASSNIAQQGDQQVGTLTIRVPATAYQDVLNQVRALGVKVDGESSNASDVTDQYSDLTASQRNLQATEQQLLTLLGQAKSISDVLQVQDRLNSVRTQIDQTTGRIALLDKLSDLATLTVQLHPVIAAQTTSSGDSLSARAHDAWQSSLDFLGSIAGGLVTVVVFAWWLPLLVLPALYVGARLLRHTSPAAAVALHD